MSRVEGNPPPPVTRKRLFWMTLLLVFVAASSVENLQQFYLHVTGREVRHVARASLDLGFGVLAAFCTIALVITLVRLFRTYR
jgi:hypothetical protein